MSKRAFAVSAALAVLALAGCTRTGAPGGPFVARAPAATVVGPPVSCIETTRIRNTKVWDDQTIDFIMNGGARYRNTLPYSCFGLGSEQRFAHQTPVSSWCDSDTITVLPLGSSVPGPTCSLGKFVPVKLAGR